MSADSFRFALALCLTIAVGRGLPAAPPRHRPPRAWKEPLDPDRVNDPETDRAIGRGDSGSAVLRAQILFDRVHYSCGEIDAHFGSNMRETVMAYQRSHGLASDGVLRANGWSLLNRDSAPALIRTTISPEDVAGPFTTIPADILEKAKLPALGYQTPLEGIAEQWHASPKLLERLNPNASFDRANAEILVPNISVPAPERAAEIVVSKSRRCVEAFGADGRMIAHYPASTGSRHDPLPLGHWKILGVARHPVFHYNPELFWDAREDEKAAIAPGPNNPVGVCWIDLSKPHYGIHGSPEPSQIGKTQSHGCVRLTNWDVTELSQLVKPGTPAFLER